MLTFPETVNIAMQMKKTLIGKVVKNVYLGDVEKLREAKFMEETEYKFNDRLAGAKIIKIEHLSSNIYICFDNGYSVLIGEASGKILFHQPGDENELNPFDIKILFDDNTALFHKTKLWGFIRIFNKTERIQHQQFEMCDRVEPIASQLTLDGLLQNFEDFPEFKEIDIKSYLVSRFYIAGLGVTYAKDILFLARIHPTRHINTLSDTELHRLHKSIIEVMEEAIATKGLHSEVDLFGVPGTYNIKMRKKQAGTLCPHCDEGFIEKFVYHGDSFYVCPICQKNQEQIEAELAGLGGRRRNPNVFYPDMSSIWTEMI